MAIFNSYVSHNQRVCWVFSSIRVPRQNIKQCMRPRSCDATTRKITMLPRYPPPTCQKINVLKLPNSGFPQKTAPKGRKFKGNIQNLGGILWSSGYWLPLCHIYISIQWPMQLHQSNLLKNLQISFLPRKFLAFHAPVALLAVLTNKNSSFYVCPWSPSTKTSLKDSSDTPQRVYQSTLNDHHTWQCVKTWYR